MSEWEILKHQAIELYPMDLKAQQEFIEKKRGERRPTKSTLLPKSVDGKTEN